MLDLMKRAMGVQTQLGISFSPLPLQRNAVLLLLSIDAALLPMMLLPLLMRAHGYNKYVNGQRAGAEGVLARNMGEKKCVDPCLSSRVSASRAKPVHVKTRTTLLKYFKQSPIKDK